MFTPPFLGSRVVKGIALDDIAEYVNETALYRNQWQFRPEKGADGVPESDDEFKARIRATFRQQLAAAKASGVLVPQVVYGYFPANGDGDDLVVWADEARTTEAARFHYPRQQAAPYLCIADFFRPVESGEADYAAFHIVTMGAAVSEETARLFAANEYQQYLLLHGLGVEMAEALAEYWHRRIREEWGFVAEDGPTIGGLFRQQYRGGRYSWGYPACPDLEDNATVAQLLDAGGSASRSARRPAGSTSPSRPRRRSSATTRRPSTSWPGSGRASGRDPPPPADADRRRHPPGGAGSGARVRAVAASARGPGGGRRRASSTRRSSRPTTSTPMSGSSSTASPTRRRSTRGWRHPPRQALLARGNDLVEDDAREQVIALAPAERAGHRRDLRPRRDPGAEEATRGCTTRPLAAMRTMPGFLRSELYAPVAGVQDDTIVMMAFDSREHLDRWLRSPERRAAARAHGRADRGASAPSTSSAGSPAGSATPAAHR